jgi:flagellar basal-body rod modification protein FlgD
MTGVDTYASSSLGDDASSSTRARMTRDQFLKILIVQMKNQDPMDPLDNTEFLNQISALENIEAVTALADGIGNMNRLQNLVSASSLIGRTVRGIGGDGLVAGVVTGASINPDGSVDIVLDGMTTVDLRNITDLKYTVTPEDVAE